ncbi:MAG TPA: hypothetical protein VL094_13205 [Sphingomonadaceae bacterium]|nr:hypothetical protein [Sphingomonadaceae bacterium]
MATELGFARAAREKGQWTAFAEYAAKDAVMFQPGPVKAQDWLKGRANPTKALRWEPHQVWSSCDGSLAVTRGGWKDADGNVGTFTTIWERQPGGAYKWVLDVGEKLDKPLEEPDLVQAEVADCQPPPVADPSVVVTVHDGPRRFASYIWEKNSGDGSLVAGVMLDPFGKGELSVSLRKKADGAPVPPVPIDASAK